MKEDGDAYFIVREMLEDEGFDSEDLAEYKRVYLFFCRGGVMEDE